MKDCFVWFVVMVCLCTFAPPTALAEQSAKATEASQEDDEPSNALKYIGVTCVVLGVSGAFAGLLVSSFHEDPVLSHDPFGEPELKKDSLELLADITFITAAGVGAAGLIMIIIHETVIAQDPTSKEESAGLLVSPWVVDEGAGLSLQMRW